jgi:hypothetical protein
MALFKPKLGNMSNDENPNPIIGGPAEPPMSKGEFYEFCLNNGTIGAYYERYPQERSPEREYGD